MHRALRLTLPLRHLVPPLLLLAFVAILASRACDRETGVDPSAEPRTVVPRGDLAADEQSTIELFEKASPAVVHVANLVVLRSAARPEGLEVPRGSGTGFVWDAQGHVVTNFHVVLGGNDFVVTFPDRRQHRAHVVGTAASYDLAVLQVDAEGESFPPLPLGTSSDLRVGQKVFAIGNPFGLDQTLTHGLVSGLGREVTAPTGRTIYDVVQTDAAINPGNSGGPLLDSSGRVIGVTSQIASPSGGSAGVGFAIPVDTVNRVVPELIRKGGSYVRPILGVLPAQDWESRTQTPDGVVVVQVTSGSGAQRAGLEPTDVIVELAGRPIRERVDLYRVVDTLEVGQTVPVRYVRNGKTETAEVRLTGTDDLPR